MIFGRTSREDKEFRRFLYPDTDVLINKLDIRDAETLEGAERAFVILRLSQPLPPEALRLTYVGFKAIHRHMFQDIYDWAGTIRTYTTGRGPAPFALPEFIDRAMKQQFATLDRLNQLRGVSPDVFARHAAELVNEINAVHPFLDGNVRTQRTWLRVLGAQAGYIITLQSADRETWYDASRIGFERQDHRPMQELLASRMERSTVPRSPPEDRGL